MARDLAPAAYDGRPHKGDKLNDEPLESPTMEPSAWRPGARSLSIFRALPMGALCIAAFLAVQATPVKGADLVQTIMRVKPSVVAIGSYLPTRSPAIQFVGTGFVVADGRHVVTNAHVVSRPLDLEKKELPIILFSSNGEPKPREAEIIVTDKDHDLALLRIAGEPLPALAISDSGLVREGRMLVFTGFPIGMVLGFHPATHRGMVSAITPVALPGMTAKDLNARMISRIRESVYSVFQLDGTAYPGNSGSPLYDPDDGVAYGIINSVFVQGTRESAVSRPSGITYAIPARHIVDLLKRASVPGFK